MTFEEAAALLGVAVNASPEEIQAAYKKKAKTAHPDAGGSHEEFVALGAAVKVMEEGETFTFPLFEPDPNIMDFVAQHNANIQADRMRAREAQRRANSYRAADVAFIGDGFLINYRGAGTFIQVPPEVIEEIKRFFDEADKVPTATARSGGPCPKCMGVTADPFRSSVCPDCGRLG